MGTLAVVYSMGAAINSDFELVNAMTVQETMGITAVLHLHLCSLTYLHHLVLQHRCYEIRNEI